MCVIIPSSAIFIKLLEVFADNLDGNKNMLELFLIFLVLVNANCVSHSREIEG